MGTENGGDSEGANTTQGASGVSGASTGASSQQRLPRAPGCACPPPRVPRLGALITHGLRVSFSSSAAGRAVVMLRTTAGTVLGTARKTLATSGKAKLTLTLSRDGRRRLRGVRRIGVVLVLRFTDAAGHVKAKRRILRLKR